MRSFVALELPPAVREAAAEIQGRLKPTGAEVKWVRPESMHLTLKFLGEVDPGDLPAIEQALEHACRGRRALELELDGCGAFPGRGRPRVVWLGVSGQVEELAGLARAVDESLAGLGFALESRPFKAHLTLGRLRQGRRGRRAPDTRGLSRALAGLASWRGPAFRAAKVALMQSTLTPQGAIYQPLHVISLP